MKAQVGQYKFGRHRNLWGIWQYDYVSETGSSARFMVDGFLYKGRVEVVYNDGQDLFEVHLSDGRAETDVYADCLVRVIDGLVERCNDYKSRVTEEYGLTIHK